MNNFKERNVERELPKGVYPYDDRYIAKRWDMETNKHYHVGIYATVSEAAYARQVAMYGHHWIGMPLGAEKKDWGFIYLITNIITGKQYIGKKQFLWWNGPSGGYKCTNRNDDFWFTPSAWKDSDWKEYVSSCIPLQKDIAHFGQHNFTFEVLGTCEDKLSLHLAEVEEMMARDVLEAVDEDGEYAYYNANIASLEFRAPFRKDKVLTATAFTQAELVSYYLKPYVCTKCQSVIPFGHNECKECS